MLTLWNDPSWSGMERPYGTLAALRREMDRIFGAADWPEIPINAPYRAGPQFDMHDGGSALEVRADLPGFSEDDIEISVEPGSLTVRGKREAEVPDGYRTHRRERGALEFTRSFTLPCKIEAGEATASLKNGVLSLSLPKAAEVQPRTINVKIA